MPNTIVDFTKLFSNLSYDRLVDIKDQWFPPQPAFTEADVPRQDGRVVIVTGGNSGIGLALVKLLYPTGAKIYLACRSEERARAAIKEVVDQAATTSQPGSLEYMHLDLDDLTTIKASAASFAQRESRLDILWNNAGIAGAPAGTKTKQGLEGHIGINCVGPLLFTQELLPQLREATKSSAPGATRIIWASSMIIERFAPQGGLDLAELDRMNTAGTGSENASVDYAVSKAGNWFLAVDGARRWGPEGIVSVTQNPGMINTTVWKHQPNWLLAVMQPSFYPAVMGAYTMLFSGFSNEVGLDTNGVYILPFGRLQKKNVRDDILEAIKNGKAKEFWDWCEHLHSQYC
ncbi:short-chain alcohol dehydrogenase [Diaporthe eres]|uniref:Short-chain alcohol dehydrogenase n=1 Tax=Diaporthe eres TaxID=83184 RepID=A0ABR1NLX8_DIAER